MINRCITFISLLILMVTLTSNGQATPPSVSGKTSLVYVNLDSPDDLSRFGSSNLPLYAMLDGGLLTGANQIGQLTLQKAGLSFQVLDIDLHSGSYYHAESKSSRPAPDYATYGLVLLETNNGVLLRMDPSRVDDITRAGVELYLITLTPKPLPATQNNESFSAITNPDPLVQSMIDQITQAKVADYDLQLAGQVPVYVDGDWYTILSRYTYSGTPIEKTMHYVYEHLQELGLEVEYHEWGGTTYPNVIGQITGLTNPEDIYIIGAHIDDVQGTPGTDDNSSGSTATLVAAEILSQYQWGCTLRFALWTGEEQGLKGSHAYAQRSYQTGENILGYLNLDMLAWNSVGSQPGIDLIYNPDMTTTLELAQVFSDVVETYNLSLIPDLRTSLSGGSDHSSFWDYGYTSILAIEDQGDFNPYYHGSQDIPENTNLAYFTDFVKASMATFAQMSDCLIPIPLGNLDGHVTEDGSGLPIQSATVTSQNNQDHSFAVNTDENGYYSQTLPAGTYTVTASAYGYQPISLSGTTISTDTVTTLDFALQPACEPVTNLDFTWSPPQPLKDQPITFTTTSNGTLPIDFQWSFGDGYTSSGTISMHTYADAGTYKIELSAANSCGEDQISKKITVTQILKYFLSLVYK